jgi:hypothetical protein
VAFYCAYDLLLPTAWSWLACDLPEVAADRSGSKPGARVLSDATEVSDFTAAARQIVGKPTPTACGQNQKRRLCTSICFRRKA